MLQTRIIPVLLLKNGGLYKGIGFKNHTYVGDPINTIKLFNDKEVDELVILDIEASKENKSIDFEILEEIVSEAFMPVAYGGGIKSIDDAKRVFSLGIEKIVLNTSAVLNNYLIKELVDIYGSQSILFSLDYKKSMFGYNTYIKSGSEKIGSDIKELAMKMQDLGIGEIILNSIDNDGKMNGYDLKVLSEISNILTIPVIVAGGAKTIDDFKLAKSSGASACAASSMFVYHGPHRAVLISYPNYSKLREILGE